MACTLRWLRMRPSLPVLHLLTWLSTLSVCEVVTRRSHDGAELVDPDELRDMKLEHFS
jgi:hypothetical protein